MERATARIFNSGRSQALRLPKAYNFVTKEVYIERDGDKVILIPKPSVTWESESGPCPDFELDRSENEQPEERELF